MTGEIRTTGISLDELILPAGDLVQNISPDMNCIVSSVEYDSRRVVKGSLFIAVEGLESDGHSYIQGAVEKGAAAVIVSPGRIEEFKGFLDKGVCLLSSDNSRRALSALSDAFYGHPSRDMTVIGITGTNGKTSITYMIESILNTRGLKTGVIGTINYRWGAISITAANTTPESKDLQEILYKMKKDGVEAVIMEVSSHALDLNRVDHIDFNTAVFTNLTRDHLDYHHDFEEYFRAKCRFFDILEDSSKDNRFAVVNHDDSYGERIINENERYSYPVLSFGIEKDSDYQADGSDVQNKIDGLGYSLLKPEKDTAFNLQLAGTFHVYNSLAALAVCHRLGIDFDTIARGLVSLDTVPGRFDVLNTGLGFSIIVDYAHTVDALLKLLLSVKEIDHSRIITVFGCGGDRDKTKRPLMGQVAEEHSDVVIVTSDNPRTEDPQSIIDDITAGLQGDSHEVIADRESAIKHAIYMGEPGDLIVIAGKGHEDYQIIGTEKIHFDDREIAAQNIEGRMAG